MGILHGKIGATLAQADHLDETDGDILSSVDVVVVDSEDPVVGVGVLLGGVVGLLGGGGGEGGWEGGGTIEDCGRHDGFGCEGCVKGTLRS
mmetsp:Transcript_25888/g.42734  ORF Transcript_25888/g.42734 Transcript_25888/m.42734 type:complete len:91 (-) Transcript_25888:332-604(-)